MLLGGRLTQASRLGNASKIGPFFSQVCCPNFSKNLSRYSYFRSYWNSYTMKHEENEKLDRIYALLVKLGYEMSDDEKALQDGTHELFGEATGE